jgi:hypothetical protein
MISSKPCPASLIPIPKIFLTLLEMPQSLGGKVFITADSRYVSGVVVPKTCMRILRLR